MAIFIGLAGVLVIIQPGSDSFSALSILAVIGMLGFAGRDLASRAAPASLGTSVLGVYGFASVFVAGALFGLWEDASLVRPDPVTALYICGAVTAGVAAYSSLMIAMRTGEVSAVTPFRYTRVLFGITLGVVWFGESLSAAMLLGSGLIVLSGPVHPVAQQAPRLKGKPQLERAPDQQQPRHDGQQSHFDAAHCLAKPATSQAQVQ